MKLLPAALLTLLSATSSILPFPSVAAEKESASGVARKLSAKAGDDKSTQPCPNRPYRRKLMVMDVGIALAWRLTKLQQLL